MKIINTLLLALLVLCTGCATLVEKSGQALDGSAFAEKKIAVYSANNMEVREVQNKSGQSKSGQNKAGEHSLIITLKQFPALKLRASAPNGEGNFYLTAMDYLGGSYHGWNEYRLDLSGTGTAQFGDNTLTLRVNEGVEPVGISAGRIRRYDTRLTGTEALSSLRNRGERITALVEWMQTTGKDLSKTGFSSADFENYWKPVLFPELVSRKKRPQDWQQAGDTKVRAEGVNWNAGYTERVFPEELRSVRDSGTMLRDWEEAVSWIYHEYAWEYIMATLSAETVLHKK